MSRRGSVFADHYHSRLLRTPTEVVNALAYVLGNYAHHFGGAPSADSFSSGVYDASTRLRVLAVPVGWLLRVGWQRARSVPEWLERQLLEPTPGDVAFQGPRATVRGVVTLHSSRNRVRE